MDDYSSWTLWAALATWAFWWTLAPLRHHYSRRRRLGEMDRIDLLAQAAQERAKRVELDCAATLLPGEHLYPVKRPPAACAYCGRLPCACGASGEPWEREAVDDGRRYATHRSMCGDDPLDGSRVLIHDRRAK